MEVYVKFCKPETGTKWPFVELGNLLFHTKDNSFLYGTRKSKNKKKHAKCLWEGTLCSFLYLPAPFECQILEVGK